MDVSGYLAQHPEVTKLRVEGHSNNRANDGGRALSRQRALVIVERLKKSGVEGARLVAVFFGESRPIADNATAVGRALNDRVELKVVEIAGRPLEDLTAGGTPVP
jgi:OOP family OmpA-OmpF porin